MRNRNNEKNRKLKFWLLGIAAFLIAAVFCLWPTQYYIEAPGEAFQISKYVKSTRKANPNFLFGNRKRTTGGND